METEKDESEGGRVRQEQRDAFNISKAWRLLGDSLQPREAEDIHPRLQLLLFHGISSFLSKLNTSGRCCHLRGDLRPWQRSQQTGL